MDGVVHGDEIQARITGRVGEPGVEEYGGVVVPVEEHDILLLQDEEDGVQQLKHLGDGKEHDPQASGTITIASLEIRSGDHHHNTHNESMSSASTFV